MPKKVMLILPHMIGGGAERVASLLMNSFAENGYETEMVLTSDRSEDVVRCDLDDKTTLTLLPECMPAATAADRVLYGVLLKLYAQVFCNLFELFRLPVPAHFAKASLYVQYYREIRWLRNQLGQDPDVAVIAFLQPAIPITMLAARGLPNRVGFSERCDSERLMKKRYGRKFIERYYQRSDFSVFQTDFARVVYPSHIAEKGVVIPNPLKEGLPAPYTGERSKRITTFCRISRQKNLPLLVDAFALFYRKHPDYTLRIIGGSDSEEGREVEAEVRRLVETYGLSRAVFLEPFSADVHDKILADAMYVNSSDFEGLSNAMLEAMVIGLPCICTDCPAGGARATIRDGENGLLVPMGDKQAMADAMLLLADDPALAERLSENAAALRDSLSLETVSKKWMELLEAK